jgi:hypothetical protein
MELRVAERDAQELLRLFFFSSANQLEKFRHGHSPPGASAKASSLLKNSMPPVIARSCKRRGISP